jgi:oligopeptide/dipeptide ABC transporter ATP-binding protein
MGMSILLITHDLGVVAETCDDVVVMYAGRVVEQAATSVLFESPRHHYTAGLLASVPRVGGRKRLDSIPGAVPPLDALPAGCRFHPRCDHYVAGRCDAEPPEAREVGRGVISRCLRAEELELPGLVE